MDTKRKLLFISFCILVLLFIQFSCHRRPESVNVISSPEDRVIDSAALLTETQKTNIFKLIQAIEENTGSQVAILLINTLNGKDINLYSIQVAENLRLGRLNYKDGVLITVSYTDHKVRIEVGAGLEKIIKDEIANRIISDQMIPQFKENRVYEGLYSAIDTIGVRIDKNKILIGSRP